MCDWWKEKEKADFLAPPGHLSQRQSPERSQAKPGVSSQARSSWATTRLGSIELPESLRKRRQRRVPTMIPLPAWPLSPLQPAFRERGTLWSWRVSGSEACPEFAGMRWPAGGLVLRCPDGLGRPSPAMVSPPRGSSESAGKTLEGSPPLPRTGSGPTCPGPPQHKCKLTPFDLRKRSVASWAYKACGLASKLRSLH